MLRATSPSPLAIPDETTPASPVVNILMVDDQPANLLALRAILVDLGRNLVEAHSGEEALRRVLEQDFAVILLDVQMEGMDGYETAQLIRSRNRSRHTPIIFLTAYEDNRLSVEQAYMLGAVDYLVKPLLPNVLRCKVGIFVELFQKTRDVQQLQRQELDRRLAEENARLRESEERYRAVTSITTDILWRTDAAGEYVEPQESWEKFTGQTWEQHKGSAWVNAVHPEDRDRVAANWRRACETRSLYEVRCRMWHSPTQSWRHIVGRAVPLVNADGSVREWIGCDQDVHDQTVAEEALSESTGHLRIVTDSMAAPVSRCSRDLRYLWVSKPYADWARRWVEDIVGRPIVDILGQPAVDDLLPHFQEVLSGREVRYEKQVDFQGLGPRWINAVYTPTRDAAGVPNGWVAVINDIDERKKLEESLRASEERLRLAVKEAGLGWWDIDLRGSTILWSPTHFSLLGYEPTADGRATVRAWSDRIHPEDQGRVLTAFDQAWQGHTEYSESYRIVRADNGQVRWVRAFGRFLLDEQGQPVRSVGIMFDDTEQRQAQERERERVAELEALMRATPTPIWVSYDPHCRHVSGNPAAFKLLGLPEGTNLSPRAVGHDPAERGFREYRGDQLVPPDELPVLMAAKGVTVNEAELKLVFDHGRARYIYGNAEPLYNREGIVRGVVAAFADVTPLKEAEAALREADRHKDEFLATLAHELRNPLAPIRNALQLLKLSPERAVRDQARAMLERQVQQLGRLVDDLLDVSRISRNKIDLRKEPIEIAKVIESALETSRPLLEAARHELVVTVPPAGLCVEADSTRLAQVFANLLNNAAKYTPVGGQIALTAARTAAQVEVRVKDDGIGLASDMLSRIFEMFTQADSSVERKHGGLGIGLTLVRSLVEMHGGTV